jgi:hypothetical protein
MGIGIDHPAWNFTFSAPPGEEERVGDLRVFITVNPQQTQITSVTCAWELNDDEIAEIVKTRRVMINTMGGGLLAHYITSESFMRQFVTDFGKTW